jgi:putative radical SAM enzyme (TIGR03279 family)
MIRVEKVRGGSIAAELEIAIGSRLLRLNGQALRDALDLQYLEAAEFVELDVETPEGERLVYEIEKDASESLGLVPEPDKIRRCTNACPFCFVKGNPKGEKLRHSLYIKDDDYRLSFMYGHYVTLTNLREADWERIAEQRLSPLYVSVHATDPDARARLLVNPRSRQINEHLDRLEASRIACHAQVVLCPGFNDGLILDRTIQDLYDRGGAVLSLSVVPVGLTRFNRHSGIRALTPAESREAIGKIEVIRAQARSERGYAWCYAADELFLSAGLEVPGTEYFDEEELASNGVGAISRLRGAVRADLPALPELGGRRVLLLTGRAMGLELERLGKEIEAASGAKVRTAVLANSLYGPLVTSAGLLPGRDFLTALRASPSVDLALLPDAALNAQGLFLDDLSLDDLRSELPDLEIRAADHVTDVLQEWG